jgi:hypothetical protein
LAQRGASGFARLGDEEGRNGSVITVCEVQSSVPLVVEGKAKCRKSITLEGIGMAAFNGIPSERPITVRNADVELAGFLITGRDVGRVDQGGVALVEDGSLTLRNVTLMGGEATQGGGIYADAASSVTLINSILHTLKAVDGGAVYTEGEVTVEGGELRNNAASGAATLHGETVNLYDALVYDNQSGDQIALYGQTVVMEGTYLHDNDKSGVVSGGEVTITDSSIIEAYADAVTAGGPATLTDLRTDGDLLLNGGVIKKCDFEDQKVVSGSGDLKVIKSTFAQSLSSATLLWVSGDSLEVRDSQFTAAEGTDVTAILVDVPVATLDGVTITGATVAIDGFAEGGGVVSLIDSTLEGGDTGVQLWQRDLTCDNSLITGFDRGIHLEDGEVKGCAIRNNSQGMYTYEATLKDVELRGNSVGAIKHDGGDLMVKRAWIDGNQGNGAAIFVSDPTRVTVTVQDSDIINNTAVGSQSWVSGGVVLDEDHVLVSKNTQWMNSPSDVYSGTSHYNIGGVADFRCEGGSCL